MNNWIQRAFEALLGWFDRGIPATVPAVPNMPLHEALPAIPTVATSTVTVAPTAQPAKPQTYNWNTPEAARHSVRVICDEEGLTVAQKNLLSQVVHCESGYLPNITHPNLSGGKVFSTDFGIAQWNDFYHSKEITPDDALHNPEKAIRLMCKYVKAGQIKQWVCYSSGLYTHYSA